MEEERLRKAIMASLTIIESSSDPLIIDEAEKIRKAIKSISAIKETPEAQELANTVRDLDSSFISKYGYNIARVLEFLLIVAVAAKIYFIG